MSLDETVSTAWAAADEDNPEATLTFFTDLLEQDPTDPVRQFELACAYDWMGREPDAIPLYEAAIRTGLAGDRDRRARIQLGSSLRNVGRPEEAATILEQVTREHPDCSAAECFLALALVDSGRPSDAVSRLVGLIARTATDEASIPYRQALQRHAGASRQADAGMEGDQVREQEQDESP